MHCLLPVAWFPHTAPRRARSSLVHLVATMPGVSAISSIKDFCHLTNNINATLLSRATIFKRYRPNFNAQSPQFQRNFSGPSDATITINQRDTLLYFSHPSLSHRSLVLPKVAPQTVGFSLCSSDTVILSNTHKKGKSCSQADRQGVRGVLQICQLPLSSSSIIQLTPLWPLS